MLLPVYKRKPQTEGTISLGRAATKLIRAKMEDSVKVEADCSLYSQVVFLDVPRSYPLRAPVVCTCHLTGDLKPTSKDWIGLFKVGWDSIQKHYTYVWVDNSLDQGGHSPFKLQVVFKESYLPKDDGEFYQFCYVDSSGQVRGASTPFCFLNPAEESLDCSLDDDLLVVTTQEQVDKMKKEKMDLLTKIDHLTEENAILKNELNERLQEILHIRKNINTLKANAATTTFPVEEQKPESAEQLSQQPEPHSYEENETKSFSHCNEKFEKASQKIAKLKQERAQLNCQIDAQQAEISELKSSVTKSEQRINRVQDQLQLLQVDMQSSRKENERLQAELELQMGMKKNLEKLQENKAINPSLSEQGLPEGEKILTKMQIQTVVGQLSKTRATLRKEIQNSNKATIRAEKAELEIRKLKNQLEEKLADGDKREERIQIETEFEEARRKITEQANMLEVARLEKEYVSEENKKLREERDSLETLMSELSLASTPPVSNNPQQHQRHPSLGTAANDYESISDVSGFLTDRNMVCRHCQESFPDISEEELAIHERFHKVCPFCSLICDDYCQEAFENHVYSHEE